MASCLMTMCGLAQAFPYSIRENYTKILEPICNKVRLLPKEGFRNAMAAMDLFVVFDYINLTWNFWDVFSLLKMIVV